MFTWYDTWSINQYHVLVWLMNDSGSCPSVVYKWVNCHPFLHEKSHDQLWSNLDSSIYQLTFLSCFAWSICLSEWENWWEEKDHRATSGHTVALDPGKQNLCLGNSVPIQDWIWWKLAQVDHELRKYSKCSRSCVGTLRGISEMWPHRNYLMAELVKGSFSGRGPRYFIKG